jgi:hypothetical protein
MLSAAVLLVGPAFAPAMLGQAAQTFTATASVKTESKSATAPVRIAIDELSSEADQKAVMGALRSGGTPAVKDALSKMKDLGTIVVGERKAPIRYAFARPTGSGRLLTVVTAEPLLHLGSQLPDAKPKAGYDVAVAILVLDQNDAGQGELAPAAKVKTNESGAIVIEDYGSAKIWLKNIAKAK